MATLANIPRRAVGIVRLKQPENLGPGEARIGNRRDIRILIFDIIMNVREWSGKKQPYKVKS